MQNEFELRSQHSKRSDKPVGVQHRNRVLKSAKRGSVLLAESPAMLWQRETETSFDSDSFFYPNSCPINQFSHKNALAKQMQSRPTIMFKRNHVKTKSVNKLKVNMVDLRSSIEKIYLYHGGSMNEVPF